MTADRMRTRCWYFAYGSNLHPVRMAARLDAPRLVDTACLHGWTLLFDKRGRDGTGKCTIARADDVVHGALYALSPADRARLDFVEGLGVGYDAMLVELPGVGPARTYVARPAARASGLPIFDWYLGLVIAGARHLRFPEPYLARLAALRTLPDPDRERAALHAKLLAACAAHPPFERIPPAATTK